MSIFRQDQTHEGEDFAVVALLDALGTKGILDRGASNGLLSAWNTTLLELEERIHVLDRELSPEKPYSGRIRLLTFSDTIFISIVPTDETQQVECLNLMGQILNFVIWKGIVDGLYLRGAISCGRLHFRTETSMLGDAIEEAALWYEEADWMGIIATPSTGHLIDQMVLEHRSSSVFVLHDVPTKSKSGNASWALDWPRYAMTRPGFLRTMLLRSFRAYSGAISPGVRSKYSNTLAFANMRWDSLTASSTTPDPSE